MVTFYWYEIVDRLRNPVQLFDAAGLALFAVSGAGKALAFQAGPFAATLLGMLTGIGGGMVREGAERAYVEAVFAGIRDDDLVLSREIATG